MKKWFRLNKTSRNQNIHNEFR